MGNCNPGLHDPTGGALKLSASGNQIDLIGEASTTRPASSEDTPPQTNLIQCGGVELGDQEATPTFKMEVAFASGAKSDEKAKAKAKALSQMAGELCTAAVEGDLPTLQQLLQAGHVVNAGDYDRRTAIHIAASEGNKQVVAYLLSQSADPTARDRWGHTALDEATRAGHREVVELLTEHSPPTDTAGFTRQASGMEQAAMLCSAAATGWTAQIEKLLASRADPSAADYDQRTPLHVACSHRNAQVVRMLLEAKASYNAHDAFGRTPVDEALTNHDLDVMKELFQAGAHVLDNDGTASTDVKVLKTMAATEHWLIPAEEVTFDTCLSTTIKSAVYVANWRGLKVVAKTVKDVSKTKLSVGSSLSDQSDSTAAIARHELMHEMRTLSTLRHPDLVLFLGASLDSGTTFFLTEYMEGGDVENYMRMNRKKSGKDDFKPPFNVGLQWCISMARALSFLHGCARPIIHRDFKPLNLLLTKELKLKVTDFGLSKIMRPKLLDPDLKDISPAPNMSGGVGTYRYMAPEVVRYEQYTDKIDIYAMALIMYYILSGRVPFYDQCGSEPEKILQAYIRREEPRPTLSSSIATAELRQLMMDAWAIDAIDRPSAQDCVERLLKIPSTKHKMFGLF